MSDRKVETIKIGGGVDYAKVAARSAAFHEDNEKCSVETTCEFKEGYALFTATVTTKKGTFTGHSMGKVTQQKALEKLETISVGRALAFAGYLATGDIATYEEMSDMVTTAQLNSLKLKYAKEFAHELESLDRAEKQQKFSSWCRSIIGEDVDYGDPSMWDTAWYQTCWQHLNGASSDVPFDAE